VHRHDGRGLRGDGRFDARRIHIQGVRIDIDEHRLDAVPQQRMGGRDKRIRGGDDLAGDAQCLQRRNQCQRTVAEQGDMLDAQILAQFGFELLVKRAAIGQYPAVPDLLQIGDEVFQRR